MTVDAFALSDGSQYRGIGRVLSRLLEGLPAYVEVQALASPEVVLPDGVGRRDLRRHVPARLRRRVHELELPRLIARSGAQVFHSPAQNVPRTSAVPWVQTLHDLTPLVFRHPLLEADRRRWLAASRSLRHASLVVADSRSSADQGVRLIGLDPARMRVARPGVDGSFSPHGPSYDLGRPYVLWLSSWGPHKNVEAALRALEAIADAGLPHHLLLAGHQDGWMRAQMERHVAQCRVPERVSFAGWVDDPADLYRGAAAVLVTSRAEGFGLPALEALACGRALVSYDNTSLPEVVGDAGVLVTDDDLPAYCRAVVQVLRDRPLRDDLEQRGPVRAEAFTWQAMVRAYAEFYEEAAEAA